MRIAIIFLSNSGFQAILFYTINSFFSSVFLKKIKYKEEPVKRPPPETQLHCKSACFFILASLICNSAAGLASALAGRLAFATSAILCAFSHIAGIQCLNVLHDLLLSFKSKSLQLQLPKQLNNIIHHFYDYVKNIMQLLLHIHILHSLAYIFLSYPRIFLN